MKSLACAFAWRPVMDSDLERQVKKYVMLVRGI